MTDSEIRDRARKALRRVDPNNEVVQVEADARVILLDDPHASGYAVEAWIYLMDDEAKTEEI